MIVGINGIGRIGKSIIRAIIHYDYPIQIIKLGTRDGVTIQDIAHTIKYDSTHGRLEVDIKIIDDKTIKIGSRILQIATAWSKTDVVMECTGTMITMDSLMSHISNGAKSVILSAPPKDPTIPTFIIGANHDKITPKNNVISIGSCTTNCLAPVAKVINDAFGIEKGFVSTVHAYTNDQNLVDASHKDKRRARAAAVSIIPTSTGATKAIGLVLPELDGVLGGSAIRVPVINVSMIDCSFVLRERTSVEKVIEVIKSAVAKDFFSTSMSFTNEPLVSVDFMKNKFSSIVDLQETKLIDGNLLRIVSWYDNEWSFATRMIDTALLLGKLCGFNL